MTILRLIDKLQQLKDLHGNMIVESRDPDGKFNKICDVSIVDFSEDKEITNWRVYLEA